MNDHDSREQEMRQVARRAFLTGAAAGLAGGGALGWKAWEVLSRRVAGGQSAIGLESEPRRLAHGSLGVPGPYPGRVIEVHHPGSVMPAAAGVPYAPRNRQAIRAMLARGMRELVGCDHSVEAWRRFFRIGDRVGIKVVPVGQPDSISSYEVVLEVIAGLQLAGVRLNDILVFERYKDAFLGCGYHRILPAGVHWECSSAAYDDAQLEIDGQLPGKPKEKHVAGYDADVYREESFCNPSCDPSDDRRFRSHVSRIITRKVDKFISIPVLKDHRSAGVTLCLKNLSHGSVNNVARSHITDASFAGSDGRAGVGSLNQCGTFIPAMVALPPIREKAVLQILDGLVGTYEGGPGNWNSTFATWQHKSLLLATDPVALDHVGWEIIDQKRAKEGWPRIASMGLDAGVNDAGGKPYPESFHIRQPQHVPLGATLGLGIFDRQKIEHRRIHLA